MSFCPACGASNPSEARFCSACGRPLGSVAAEPAQQPVVANPYAISSSGRELGRGQWQQPRNSTLAIVSLVAGILQLFCCCFGGLVAVICGHLARSEIRKSEGQILGDGMALAGLILGYLGLAGTAVYFLLVFIGVALAPLAN